MTKKITPIFLTDSIFTTPKKQVVWFITELRTPDMASQEVAFFFTFKTGGFEVRSRFFQGPTTSPRPTQPRAPGDNQPNISRWLVFGGEKFKKIDSEKNLSTARKGRGKRVLVLFFGGCCQCCLTKSIPKPGTS